MSTEQNNSKAKQWQPLAERLRPCCLDEFIGQQHILGNNSLLKRAIQSGDAHSMILWGPPGTGKTTLAKLLANSQQAKFLSISAVLGGVKDIRQAVEQAKTNQQYQRKTILFVDEVHRFNKSQQDAFLPHIEDGTIIFIGATTENPSFELNNALLSRTRTYLLKPLSEQELHLLIQRAIKIYQVEKELPIEFENDLSQLLVQMSDGDARILYNYLELILEQGLIHNADNSAYIADAGLLKNLLRHSNRRFDKQGDVFYDQLSAFHKSIRGSSPDGALYWLARMLDGGCDPRVPARRLLAIASEDIGNADPRAIQLALNAWDTFARVGPTEGNRAIAQAAVYCAVAPKSNAVYLAFKQAMKSVKEQPSHEVPYHLRNAVTDLGKSMGFGQEYRYAHDEEDAFSAGQSYFPEELGEQQYYHPVERGLEIKISEKLAILRQKNQKSSKK